MGILISTDIEIKNLIVQTVIFRSSLNIYLFLLYFKENFAYQHSYIHFLCVSTSEQITGSICRPGNSDYVTDEYISMRSHILKLQKAKEHVRTFRLHV